MPDQVLAGGVLLSTFGNVVAWLFLGLLLFKVFCFVDAAIRREDAYRAADKQKKVFWLVILGAAVAWDLLLGSLIGVIAGIIAAIVYMVDVRPALKEVGNGRRGGRMGPYGPW